MQHSNSGFALSQGVSYCLTDSRVIFLDQKADRYLALGEEQDHAVGALASSREVTLSEREQLNTLVDEGLLAHAARAEPPQPCSHRVPARAIIASRARSVPTLSQLCFAWQVMAARRRLRRLGLYKSLQSLHRFRTGRGPVVRNPLPILQQGADLLAVIGRYMTRLDQCLPISIGFAHHLLRQGVECDVVLGVQLGPFRAHCWVQHRDQLVGDDLDVVRTFTPILVA